MTRPLRQAVSDYLSTLEYVFIDPAEDVPDPPAYDRLLEAGIVDDDRMRRELRELAEELETRRALLHGYVQHDGWTLGRRARRRRRRRGGPGADRVSSLRRACGRRRRC